MRKTSPWQNRLYATLFLESQQSRFQRHCAYFAAGWLSLFFIRPKFPNAQAASFATVLGAAVLLVVLLILSGKLLSWMQPIFVAFGRAHGEAMVLAVVALLCVSRYLVGRSLLRAYAAHAGAA